MRSIRHEWDAVRWGSGASPKKCYFEAVAGIWTDPQLSLPVAGRGAAAGIYWESGSCGVRQIPMNASGAKLLMAVRDQVTLSYRHEDPTESGR